MLVFNIVIYKDSRIQLVVWNAIKIISFSFQCLAEFIILLVGFLFKQHVLF